MPKSKRVYGIMLGFFLWMVSVQITGAGIDSIQFNEKLIADRDIVASQPLITAYVREISPNKIVSWNVQIKDITSHELIEQKTTVITVPSTNEWVVFQVTKPLRPNNLYQATLKVQSDTGVISSANSAIFLVKEGLEITGFLNAPNPFNPNQGNTSLEYMLSKDADVKLAIFSISGEEVWSVSYLGGQDGGRVGFNTMVWNGRNKWQDMVANGVYIGVIVAKSGMEKRIVKRKIAVLK